LPRKCEREGEIFAMMWDCERGEIFAMRFDGERRGRVKAGLIYVWGRDARRLHFLDFPLDSLKSTRILLRLPLDPIFPPPQIFGLRVMRGDCSHTPKLWGGSSPKGVVANMLVA
jgi:hypothetical protein